MNSRSRSAHDERAAEKYEHRSSRYMSRGGKRIHYCIEGRGPTLLLLHGVLSSSQSWQGWVDQLASHHRVVRLDLPGFGLSEHHASDDYSPEHALELIDHVRAQLHVERFSIAGNSLGGFLAWYYAAHRPEHVDKLVLIDPIGYPQLLPPATSFVSWPLVGELFQLVAPRALIEHNVRLVHGEPGGASEAALDRSRALLQRGSTRQALVQSLRTLRGDHQLSRDIPRVRAQTLIMWGQEDRWVPISQLDAWRRDLPMAQVRVYPGVGHLPMEEIPELTAADAHAFLSSGDAEAEAWEDASSGEFAVPFVYARGA